MLSRWLDRGLGQILAPDEKVASQPQEEEGMGILWQILAPDPKFSSSNSTSISGVSSLPRVPPSSAFLSPPPSSSKVQCVHCHQWTPSKQVSHDRDGDVPFHMPSPNVDTLIEDVDQLVLSAAKDTATSLTSPPNINDARNKIFRICSNPNPIQHKLLDRLRQLFIKDPSLIQSRANNFGNAVPDGFTPLMAAAYVDRVEAVKVILELSPQRAHTDRDLQGRTPLHIAADRGHVQSARVLREHEGTKTPPRTDLTGRTPLGRALTSIMAAKNQAELQQVLFSPDDTSVRGVPTPAKTRIGLHRELELVAGHAEMPGFRVTMEDALLCYQSWTTKEEAWALFGVCDGHNDHGQASQYMVDRVGDVLRDSMDQYKGGEKDWSSIWTKTTLQLDASYKETEMGGGTTAVFALVSAKSIVVANIGDSRCILVQRETETKQSTGQETQTDVPELTVEGGGGLAGYLVTPLSQDHKPDLPEERERVTKAGLTVTEETFRLDGKDCTICKVSRSATERIAMSRSLGDYEYKSNVTLAPEEQAVVAVPEVRVHSRDIHRDAFLVLACDGVWDVMSNDEVAKFVVDQVEKELEQNDDGSCLAKVADRLLEKCLELGSRDNMSVVLVALSAFAEKISAGQIVRGKALDFALEHPASAAS